MLIIPVFNDKKVASQIFFDCLCGVISAILAIVGLVLVTLKTKIDSTTTLTISFTFWIGYLIFSFAMISFGIRSKIKERNFELNKTNKPIKQPIR